MLTTIIRKTVADFFRDARTYWATGILTALFAIGFFNGYHYFQNHQTIQQVAQQTTYEQWLDQGEKNPHGAAHFGIYAFKPVPLLAIIDKGMYDYLGTAVWLEAHNQNEVAYRLVQDQTMLARFGDLSVGFVLVFLMPLFIILFTFDQFSGERESGTLRLLLSTGVRPTQLLAGKFIGLFSGLLLVLTPFFLLGNGLLYAAAGSDVYFSNVGQIAVLSGLLLAYYALCMLAGLWVSAFTKRSNLSLFSMLGIWVFMAFIAPRLNAHFAKSSHPTPSSIEFTMNVNRDKYAPQPEETPAKAQFVTLQERLEEEYGVEVEALPLNEVGMRLQESEEHSYQVYDKHFGQLFEQFEAQNETMQQLSVLSPVLLMRKLAMGFSGTALPQHLDFTQQAEEHRREMQFLLNKDFAVNGAGIDNYTRNRDLWSNIPPFEYQVPSFSWTLEQQLPTLLFLLGWLGVLTLGTFFQIQKIRV